MVFMLKTQPDDDRALAVGLEPLFGVFEAVAHTLKDSGRHLSPVAAVAAGCLERLQLQPRSSCRALTS